MEAGISTEAYFPQALHLAPACRALGGQEGQFPASERASRRLLAVPLYPELEQPQIEYVCTQLRSILDQTG